MLKRKFLISIDISTGSYADFVSEIVGLAQKKISSYVCVANVHMLIEAYYDKTFAAVVNGADIVTPDGMPLTKGINSLYKTYQDRVAGMDLLPDLLTAASVDNIPVYFYGGTQPMLDMASTYIAENYRNLKVAGMFSPPFRPLKQNEEDDVINAINSSNAGMVFVVLGCPKQERWMASMKGKINACMLGVGGALPVMAGMQKRAPVWMQENNLEWLYRLSQEPKRLFKRYFITNSVYMALSLKEYLTSKVRPANYR